MNILLAVSLTVARLKTPGLVFVNILQITHAVA